MNRIHQKMSFEQKIQTRSRCSVRSCEPILMTGIMATVPMTRKVKASKMDKYVNY